MKQKLFTTEQTAGFLSGLLHELTIRNPGNLPMPSRDQITEVAAARVRETGFRFSFVLCGENTPVHSLFYRLVDPVRANNLAEQEG
jgi:hypothetical protein